MQFVTIQESMNITSVVFIFHQLLEMVLRIRKRVAFYELALQRPALFLVAGEVEAKESRETDFNFSLAHNLEELFPTRRKRRRWKNGRSDVVGVVRRFSWRNRGKGHKLCQREVFEGHHSTHEAFNLSRGNRLVKNEEPPFGHFAKIFLTTIYRIS